jgi:hypothetical protein
MQEQVEMQKYLMEKNMGCLPKNAKKPSLKDKDDCSSESSLNEYLSKKLTFSFNAEFS